MKIIYIILALIVIYLIIALIIIVIYNIILFYKYNKIKKIFRLYPESFRLQIIQKKIFPYKKVGKSIDIEKITESIINKHFNIKECNTILSLPEESYKQWQEDYLFLSEILNKYKLAFIYYLNSLQGHNLYERKIKEKKEDKYDLSKIERSLLHKLSEIKEDIYWLRQIKIEGKIPEFKMILCTSEVFVNNYKLNHLGFCYKHDKEKHITSVYDYNTKENFLINNFGNGEDREDFIGYILYSNDNHEYQIIGKRSIITPQINDIIHIPNLTGKIIRELRINGYIGKKRKIIFNDVTQDLTIIRDTDFLSSIRLLDLYIKKLIIFIDNFQINDLINSMVIKIDSSYLQYYQRDWDIFILIYKGEYNEKLLDNNFTSEVWDNVELTMFSRYLNKQYLNVGNFIKKIVGYYSVEIDEIETVGSRMDELIERNGGREKLEKKIPSLLNEWKANTLKKFNEEYSREKHILSILNHIVDAIVQTLGFNYYFKCPEELYNCIKKMVFDEYEKIDNELTIHYIITNVLRRD